MCSFINFSRGYASSFEWAGHHDDETTRDRWGRRSTQIVAIDALVFRSMISQLRPGEFPPHKTFLLCTCKFERISDSVSCACVYVIMT